MRTIRRGDIPKRNERIRWREFGVNGILLDPASGDYFEVNEVGLLIWEHTDGRRTVEEIVEELAAHFHADGEDLTEGTTEFLRELEGRGLISVG